ncbi:MAG: flippase-like domain-containing protein [Synergistaceae bacterium]|nr:flippase-like domain-containing protein [Synergistaceae bacterium]
MTVRKSFSLFVSIVVVSIIGVLFSSIDSSTFALLKQANKLLLFCAAALVLVVWFLDALKFVCLARSAGERLTLKQTIPVVMINYFGSAITPMQSGGGPFQVYLLYKKGVSVGKAVAITLVRTLQVIFLLALIVPFSLLAEPEFLGKHVILQWFVLYVLIFISCIGTLLCISFVRPQWIKRWSNWLIVKLNKLGIIRPKGILKAARRVNKEIDCYSTNIRLFFSTGKKWFAVSLFVAILHLLVYMSIMPCLILAMGFDVKIMQCILAESLFLFLLYFVPTPGSSGAAEGGAAAVFALFVPWSLAGVLAITWRVISEYSGVVLGTFIVIKQFGWGGADELLREEKAKLKNECAKE